MRQFSFGILGFGRHAEKTAAAFSRCAHCRLTAIGSSSHEKFSSLEKKYPNVKFCSYEELLSLPDLDAVYIALPNSLHEEWTLKALRGDKHVLCEKPLCVSKEQLDRLEEAFHETLPNFHLGFMYRFHPQHNWVKEFIAKGQLGTPHLFEAHFHYFLQDTTNIRLQQSLGGGALLDVGCYLFDCVDFLFDTSVRTISGQWNIHALTGTDTSSHFQLLYENGLTAHLTCGTSLTRANTYSIYGSEGTLVVRNAFRVEPKQRTVIELSRVDGSVEHIQFDGVDQAALQFDAFSKRANKQADGTESHKFTDGVTNMKILLAAQLACSSGEKIDFRKFKNG